jgi:CRISPR-associated protein Csm4
MRVCKLKLRAHFHLGEKEAVLEKTSDYIHSDTLFSAICNAYRLLYGNEELETMLKCFMRHEPPFLFSSAFVYADEILSFPLLLSIDWDRYIDDEIIEELNAERKEKDRIDSFDLLKKLKHVKFVSERIFRDLTKDERRIKDYVNDTNIIQGILFTDEEVDKLRKRFDVRENKAIKIWREREVPRVAIDRKTNSSHIYHFGEVSFATDCGLYFLMDSRLKEYEKRVEATIRVLGDEGIGGDRTYGKGLFKAEFDEIDLNREPKNHFVTLSLYYPQEEELSRLKDRYYELITRGGWIYSMDAKNLRRRTVRMFSEGSVFSTESNSGLYGGLADVKPEDFAEHDVYRYGYAFAVPLEVSE